MQSILAVNEEEALSNAVSSSFGDFDLVAWSWVYEQGYGGVGAVDALMSFPKARAKPPAPSSPSLNHASVMCQLEEDPVSFSRNAAIPEPTEVCGACRAPMASQKCIQLKAKQHAESACIFQCA